MTFLQKFLECAIHQLGKPYIWGGHGSWVWTPTGIIKTSARGCPEGFDCAGLVTFAALKAGSPDLTKTWNAQTMWDKLPEGVPGRTALALYGQPKMVQHVAIELGDTRLLLQAAGGDHTTVDYTQAVKRGAAVSLGYRGRQDLIGYRSIEALENAIP